jgi:hypothetical protein
VLPLKSPDFLDKTFCTIDVYTRFPITDEVTYLFAKKIENGTKCAGLLFGREDLKNLARVNDEHIESLKDNFIVLLLERVGSFPLKPINYHKIREKVVSLSRKSWFNIENKPRMPCGLFKCPYVSERLRSRGTPL